MRRTPSKGSLIWLVFTDALLGRGADGIISDDPNRLRTVMEARGMPLPAAVPVAKSNESRP